MGVCWFLLLMVLTSSNPNNHRFISNDEKEFIIEETKKSIETRKMCESVRKIRQIIKNPNYKIN